MYIPPSSGPAVLRHPDTRQTRFERGAPGESRVCVHVWGCFCFICSFFEFCCCFCVSCFYFPKLPLFSVLILWFLPHLASHQPSSTRMRHGGTDRRGPCSPAARSRVMFTTRVFSTSVFNPLHPIAHRRSDRWLRTLSPSFASLSLGFASSAKAREF